MSDDDNDEKSIAKEDHDHDEDSGGDKDKDNKDKKKKRIYIPIKNAADYQRMKLARLLANPDKPVCIPDRPKEKNLPPPPDFVRNIMGSSAGAGSGEFHVYRHLRRKEYARQKAIQEDARREEKDAEFQRKREDSLKKAEGRTAKKRDKRLKRKLKLKELKKNPVGGKKGKVGQDSESSSASSDENEKEDSNDQSGSVGTNEDSTNSTSKLSTTTFKPVVESKIITEDIIP